MLHTTAAATSYVLFIFARHVHSRHRAYRQPLRYVHTIHDTPHSPYTLLVRPCIMYHALHITHNTPHPCFTLDTRHTTYDTAYTTPHTPHTTHHTPHTLRAELGQQLLGENDNLKQERAELQTANENLQQKLTEAEAKQKQTLENKLRQLRAKRRAEKRHRDDVMYGDEYFDVHGDDKLPTSVKGKTMAHFLLQCSDDEDDEDDEENADFVEFYKSDPTMQVGSSVGRYIYPYEF